MSDVRVLSVTRAANFGIFENIGVWVWRRSADTAMIEQLAATLNELAKLPGGSGIVTIVGRGVTVPDDTIRKGIVLACRNVTGKVAAGGVVHERDDLVAAIVRGIVTGLLHFGPAIYPHSVFRSTTEAATFVRKRLDGKAPAIPQMVAAVDELRAVRAPE